MKKVASRIICSILVLMLVLSYGGMAYAAERQSEQLEIVEERVYQELLSGQITDYHDVLQVTVANLGKENSENGMKTWIDKNGHIQIMQVVPVEAPKYDLMNVSDYSAEMKDVICTTLLLLDKDGNEINASSDEVRTDTGGVSEVYGTHRGVYRLTKDKPFESIQVKALYMSTTLVYGTAMTASEILHTYIAELAGLSYDEYTQSTVTNPSAGRAYTYYPYGASYSVGSLTYILRTSSRVKVGNNSFTMETYLQVGNDLEDLI